MYQIHIDGKNYVSHFNISTDKIRILPYKFVLKGKINEDEWAKSSTLCTEKFAISPLIFKIDGRKKEYKKVPYFSWALYL